MKRNSVLRSWFLSYLIIIACSLCFGSALYAYAFHVVKQQSAKINQMLVEKLQAEVDGYVKEAVKIEGDLLVDKSVIKLTSFQKIGMGEQEVVLDTYKDILGKHDSSQIIDDIFIYLKNSDTVISTNGHMSSRLFYQLYYKNKDYSYEEMKSLLMQRFHGNVLAMTNSRGEKELAFLQTSLNYGGGEDSATIVVTMGEKSFEKWFDKIKWDDALEVFILGKEGLIIGGDEDGPDVSGLKYGDKSLSSTILLQGKRYALVSAYSENREWEYILLMPDKLLKKEVGKIQMFAVLGFLMCITVGMGLAYLLSKKQYRPLKLVMDQFRRQGEDPFEYSENEYQWMSGRMKKLYEERKDSKAQLKRHYLYHLLTRPWQDAPDEERLRQAGLILDGRLNIVVLAELDFEPEEKGAVRKEHQLTRFAVFNIFQELAAGKAGVEAVTAGDDLVCLLTLYSAEEDFREWLEGIADETQKRVREWFGVRVMFFAGSPEYSPDCIYTSYLHASETAGYRGVMDSEAMIWYEAIENRQFIYKYSLEEEQRIINTIRAGDRVKAKALVSEVLKNNVDSRSCLAYDLLGTLMRSADAAGLADSIGENDVKELVSGKFSYEVLEQKLLGLTGHICDRIQNKEEEQRNDCEFSHRVKEFVMRNYQNPDLNISIAALEFQITPAYLSSLFKEQMGVGLLDYINQTRVEKAKELLKEGCSVAETAERTGFRGSVAFIRVFKRITGITPGQMKRLQEL